MWPGLLGITGNITKKTKQFYHETFSEPELTRKIVTFRKYGTMLFRFIEELRTAVAHPTSQTMNL
jgi:hypothetical protein